MSTALKTMAIKARVYNQIRTDLYKKYLEETTTTKYFKYEVLTDEEKLKLFDKWFKLNKEAHQELNTYKRKRQRKAKVEAIRAEKLKVTH